MAVKKFAKTFLLQENVYSDLVAKIAFFKEHPKVNARLLDYAVTMTIISKSNFAHEIPSPLDVDNVFFDKNQEKEVDDDGFGNDYNLYM